MSYRILLVEDSDSSIKVVESALSDLGADLTVARTIDEARRATVGKPYDLILLDLLLPDGQGLSLLETWRTTADLRNVPVLLLTGREDVELKVNAFALGAEDYIVKPVNPRELQARVTARLRKLASKPSDVLRRGRLSLHFTLMKALVLENGTETPVELTSKEFRLVATLAQNEGQIFSRTQLVRAIWGDDMHVVNRTVDSHICGARRKLGAAGDYIESVTGAGYRFSVRD